MLGREGVAGITGVIHCHASHEARVGECIRMITKLYSFLQHVGALVGKVE